MSVGVGLALPQLAMRGRAAVAFDLAGGLPAGVTLTRASAGSRVNPAGIVASETADIARFDCDAATGAVRGLLVEEARTNAWVSSEQLDQAAWTKTSCTILANNATGPDGAATADKIVPGTTSGQTKCITQPLASIAAGTAITCSFFVKAAGYGFVQTFANNAVFGTVYWNVDLTNGVETAFATGTSTVLGRGIVALPGGWFRLWIAFTALVTQSGSTNSFYVTAAPSATFTRNATWSGDGTSGVHLWGMQLEIGASVTSYIATGSAIVTRAADMVTLGWGGKGVADGAVATRVTFDDLTTQDVTMAVSGGTAVLTTVLDRRRVRRVEKL